MDHIAIPCSSSPCENNGTCVNSDDFDSYGCACDSDFTGENCEIDFPCGSSPCQNNGTCVNSADFDLYTCACDSNFTGFNCDPQWQNSWSHASIAK